MSRGQIEDRVSKSLTQWEKEFLGRGSVLVKADLLRNMVIVVLKGVLTPAEKQLATTRDGLLSVKRLRQDLVESGVSQLNAIIADITGATVESFFTDVSTRTGERVMVFMLDHDVTM